jgi:hypothetical protein
VLFELLLSLVVLEAEVLLGDMDELLEVALEAETAFVLDALGLLKKLQNGMMSRPKEKNK